MIPRELVELLAAFYPTREDAVRVAEEAGLPQQHIDWQGPAVVVWQRVLLKAQQGKGTFPALIDLVTGENPSRVAEIRALLPASDEPPTGPHARRIFEGPGGCPVLPVPHFSGHEHHLQELEALLCESEGPPCVVVSGLGGVGKSALLQQFVARRAPALFPDGALWLDAAVGPFEQEIARAAKRFGLHARAPSHTERDPLTWLACRLTGRRVLVVIDDADLAHVNHRQLLVPGGGCRTVITSRSKELHEVMRFSAHPLRVEPWKLEVCRAYLRAAVPDLEAEDADLDRLAHFVEGLPLALCLVARHLKLPGKRARQLHEQLERHSIEKLDEQQQGAIRSVKATYQAAFADLAERERKVLLALSWCARATRVGVVAQVAGIDDDDVEGALFRLDERYLASFKAGARRPWGMHPMIRHFVRKQSGSAEAWKAHTEFAFACARAQDGSGDFSVVESDGVELWSAFRRLFLGLPEHQAQAEELLDTMKGYLRKVRDSGELIPAEMQAEMSVIAENPAATRELLDTIQRFIDLPHPVLEPGASSLPPNFS